jgi:hypothetical protein
MPQWSRKTTTRTRLVHGISATLGVLGSRQSVPLRGRGRHTGPLSDDNLMALE